MDSSRMSPFLVICGTLQVLAFIIFLKGYLPMKLTTSDYATMQDMRFDLDEQCNNASYGINSTQDRCFVPAVFDRMVFLLIDALRSDFVFSDIKKGKNYRMKFVQNLLKSRKAVGFVSNAHPPTVTLPRIKAITTGTVPGFVDVINNIDTQSLTEDNLVSQLRRHGSGEQVFYGDDTWLRLFPQHFIRSEGVVSFFIMDYKEVDDNVTRHIDEELSHNDWDAMFLHYLGLDHIGHLAGPFSSLVGPKLMEMDRVIQRIYRKISKQDADSGRSSLIVICGDHGMSDLGSHGGSSTSEISTALIFISTAFSYNLDNFEDVEQIDIAATLSVLLGLPIPRNSLGVLITSALEPLGTEQRLRAVYSNAKQLLVAVGDSVDNLQQHPGNRELQDAIELHSDWLTRWQDESLVDTEREALLRSGDEIIELYVRSMRQMRNELVKHQSTYDLVAMGSGIFIEACVCVCLLSGLRRYYVKSSDTLRQLSCSSLVIAAIFCCFAYFIISLTVKGAASFEAFSLFTLLPATLSALLVFSEISRVRPTGAVFKIVLKQLLKGQPGTVLIRVFLLFGSLLHVVSLMSSSFVEEEHQTWYFLTTTLLLLLIIGSTVNSDKITDPVSLQCAQMFSSHSRVKCDMNSKFENFTEGNKSRTYRRRMVILRVVVCLVLGRIARAMNQTGDKWAHLPDIGDWLIRPENKFTHSLVNLLSMLSLCLLAVWRRGNDLIFRAGFLAGVVLVYCHQAAQGLVNFPILYDSKSVSNGFTEARWVYITILFMLIYSIVSFLRSGCRCRDLVHQQITADAPEYNHTAENNARNPHGNECRKSVTSLGGYDIDVRIYSVSDLWERIRACFTVLMLLLSRSHNTALVLVVSVQSHCLLTTLLLMFDGGVSMATLTLTSLWMGHAAFFYMGNSNSLATVDLAAGYKGMSDYYIVPVSCLTFINTYSGTIYWILSLIQVLSTHFTSCSMYSEALKRSVHTILLMKSLISLPYLLLATLLRYHLFVWTVFSPKLLYEGLYMIIVTLLLTLIISFSCALMYMLKILR